MIQTVSLNAILEKYLEKDESIDFLDIDVEGLDLEVLQSNDWERFRPRVILIETENTIEKDLQSTITNFLRDVDYHLVGKSVIQGDLGNLFFINKRE